MTRKCYNADREAVQIIKTVTISQYSAGIIEIEGDKEEGQSEEGDKQNKIWTLRTHKK